MLAAPVVGSRQMGLHRWSSGSTATVSGKQRLSSHVLHAPVRSRTSAVGPAAGAIVKRLRSEDMVRVAAIDLESLPKALIVLTAANNMAQANSGHMLVFQPTAISNEAAAEPPKVPLGSMVMYTTQIMAGEVMTFNTLRVTTSTDPKALSKAIIARLAINSHTVMECYGTQALAVAVQAVAQARKGLLVRLQDCACIITSSRKAIGTDTAAAAAEDAPAAAPAAAAAAATANASSSSSSSSSKYPATCHRLVLVECEPRNPRALLMRSTVGVSDRAAQGTAAAPAAAAAAAATAAAE
ncbi:hypothetical protein OEZ86_001859 [Tetradesmus obliquus]|nr:hypothetical protein OEZ86_001859 [Tetradesmus obliquus]